MPAWLADNLLVIVTAVLALIAFAIAWVLRRAGARRGDDDEETYAYNEPALDTAAPVSYTHLTLPTNREV